MTNNATPQDAGREEDAESAPPTHVATPGSEAQPDAAAAPLPPETPVAEEAGEARPDGAQAPASAPADVIVVPPAYRPSYAFLIVVSLITLVADLGTKWWAKDRLEPPKPIELRKIEVIKDHFNLIFAKNHGGAWGILGDESEAIRRPFFLLISLAAIVFIVSLFRKLHPSQIALKWGLPFVLGGALGNLVDRVRYGFVIDFIQIRLTPTFVWPTFNVADIAIVVGVGLMAIDMFVPRRTPPLDGSKPGDKAPEGGG